jgi:hypothetical protein
MLIRKAPRKNFARCTQGTAMTQNNMEVVAYAEVIDGKVVSVRLDKSRHCTEPLVTLTSAQADIARLNKELGRLELSRGAASKVALDNIARAEAGEKERDALREALTLAEEERDALRGLVMATKGHRQSIGAQE